MRAVFALALSLAGAACAPAALPVASAAPEAEAAVGQPAPDFTLPGVDGTTRRLSEQRGKVVVLEWFNPDCPFVKYAHGEDGPLRTLGNDHAGKGVVWWAINSGAPGKQGHGLERNQAALTEYGIGYPVLLDEAGTVGKTYGAKTTPQIFVIDAAGTLAYAGALDNAPFGDSDGKAVVNYADAALGAVTAGTPVATPQTKPYGCSVKYGG